MESSSGADVLAEDRMRSPYENSQSTDTLARIRFGGRLVLGSCAIELVFGAGVHAANGIEVSFCGLGSLCGAFHAVLVTP